jgi:putative membrane-bound dehydrogenase-like protein
MSRDHIVHFGSMRKAPFVQSLAFALMTLSCLAAEVPKNVKAPPGWNVTMFAAPPNVGYPTCLSTSPNGDLYVGIDENGSIDAKPGRGRVVRCTDTDGDGIADKFVTFATMDSPRGIWFDNNVLYVQHPPLIEAFIDDDGDGKADRSEVLVRGLGFDLKFRGADHTINGMRMGIDGFLYIACGDYGGTNVVGKDGTTFQLHGGGVVRVRPDGTGLEIVSRGQRNIYDVAVSPELDLFTRDNTNDGDGWDVRLSHVVMGGNYGYPMLFKKFGDEIIQPLADYGGGSPCGALFMDEPGFPEDFGHGLYTVEWGRGGIFRHPLTPNGATFKAGQEKFIGLTRPTDFDVDGSGRLYISSWEGATFTYNGPNAGYVLRVTPPDWSFKPFPDLKKVSNTELLKHIISPSAFARLYAQREILRRGNNAEFAGGLENVIDAGVPPAPRIAAIFTLEQLAGASARDTLVRLARKDDLREFVLHAIADNKDLAATVSPKLFAGALTDANPRVRLQAVTALGRLGKTEAAPGIISLVADSDPIVAHIAVHSLAQLHAADVCLATFDSPGSTSLIPGAGRALQLMHEPRVVDGLIARLNKVSDASAREVILKSLARLANREADWDGRWWGTRPDTTGPYFKPVKWTESEKIENVLRAELAKADAVTLPSLALTLQKNRVDLPELIPTVLKLADADPNFRPAAIEMFSTRASLPDEAISFLGKVASSSSESGATRAKAIRALAKSGKSVALDAAVTGLTQPGKNPGEVSAAWEDFARDTRNGRNLNYFTTLANSAEEERRLLAYAVLANVASSRVSERNGRGAATRAVESAWTNAAGATALLRAISRLKLDGYNTQVRALLSDARPEVATAARAAAKTLKIDQQPTNASETIEKMKYEEVTAVATKKQGDAKAGEELFTRLGCVACHTTRADETPKGPFLGGIGTRYSRVELCESILKPSAKIAQGFETQWFKTRDDEEVEGFVTREGGDDLDVRNVAGITTTLAKKNIAERAKREKSIMPDGLANQITPADLASLLAFLEGLKSK